MKSLKLPGSVNSRILLVLILILLVTGIGCGRKSEDNAKPADNIMAPASAPSATKSIRMDDDASGAGAVSSSAAVVSGDSTKKFIRTADLRFKVKHTIEATYTIEDIVARHGGYVGFTKLESSIDNNPIVPVSEDSSLSTTLYTLRSTMTLRVPDRQLDTMLKEIAPLIDFLDSRIIRAEDVSLQFLAHKVQSERMNRSAQRVTKGIDSHGKKLEDITTAEDQLLDRQQQSDEAQLSNLSLLDRVKYSTIQLSIYQRQEIRRELIANVKNIDSFRPGLGVQLVDALQSGWRILEIIIVALINLWGVFLALAILIFLFKLYRKKFPIVVKETGEEEKK